MLKKDRGSKFSIDIVVILVHNMKAFRRASKVIHPKHGDSQIGLYI
jgi:hypothetical protein